jgi:shikimate kinase/catechol 2,3-dioxygenase-like lactoylglutathione lyase family enzyme
MTNRHLVVMGPMAAGKSTVGEALAGRTGRPLRDSDHDLAEAEGLTGRQFVRAKGVEALHRWEAEHLQRSLRATMPSVIAAAASVVDDPACRDDLRGEGAFVLSLTAPPEVLAARLAADDSGERRVIAGEAPDRSARFREVADVEIDASDDDKSIRIAAALAALPPDVVAGGRVSHVGVCVTDLERSLRFWRDGLGFTPTDAFDVGAEFGRLMELEDVALRSQFLRRDGVTVELLHFTSPPTEGDGARRPLNKPGLTHLSVRVVDVDAAAARVAQTGGSVLDATRTTFGEGAGLTDFVYCTDPDGTRVELMRIPPG